MNKGLDASAPVSLKLAHQIKAAGYSFVARYYSHSAYKNLTHAEALNLTAAGLYTVAVWETAGDQPSHFNYARGKQDALDALAFAQNTIKQPGNSTIYFAVDYDATSADIAGSIRAYFQAINDVFKLAHAPYAVGVYGSGAVCNYLMAAKLATFDWEAMASGWSGSRHFTGGNILQKGTVNMGGIQFDGDSTVGNGGGFQVKP